MKFIKLLLVCFFGLLGTNVFSQIPTEVPKPQDNTPVDFSKPGNIIVFIVIPVVVILLVLIWRNKRRKDQTVQK